MTDPASSTQGAPLAATGGSKGVMELPIEIQKRKFQGFCWRSGWRWPSGQLRSTFSSHTRPLFAVRSERLPTGLRSLMPGCPMAVSGETSADPFLQRSDPRLDHPPQPPFASTPPSVRSTRSRYTLAACRWRANGWARHHQDRSDEPLYRDNHGCWMGHAARPGRRRHKMAECQPVQHFRVK